MYRKGSVAPIWDRPMCFQGGNPAIPLEKYMWAEMLLKQNCELGQ